MAGDSSLFSKASMTQNPISLLFVAGARPNFMKIAPLIDAARARSNCRFELVHTGQHYDDKMSDIFFEELGIPKPAFNLGVGSLPREEQIEKISAAFEPVLLELKPDIVVVVGDVNSTIACSQVAKKHGVKVAHVEAGLRSFDMTMPEELNRIATDKISDYLFVTEQSGMDNLKHEHTEGRAIFVGNTMIDTLVKNLPKIQQTLSAQSLGLTERNYAICTFHRPSNVDTKESLTKIVDCLEWVAGKLPVVLPIHPRTKSSAERFALLPRLQAISGLTLTDPLGYVPFMSLILTSRLVFTDSGGIQEEATYLKIPCITMRENTERPSTVTLGTNTLVGSDIGALKANVTEILNNSYKSGTIPPLWDGLAAVRIIEELT